MGDTNAELLERIDTITRVERTDAGLMECVHQDVQQVPIAIDDEDQAMRGSSGSWWRHGDP